MSDRFHPLSMEQLTDWVFTELEQKGSLFNVPRSAFFVPRPDHRFRRRAVRGGAGDAVRGRGRAAHPDGPEHRRRVARRRPADRAQDDPDPRRARRQQALHRRRGRGLQRRVVAGAQGPRVVRRVPAGLGPDPRPAPPARLARRAPGHGLQHERRLQPRGDPQPNVQWYLDAMADASAYLPAYVEIVARRYPAVREIDIPARLSDTVTLSTMHGCPPDEIERISLYLIEERGLHTSVKCNPTLLGAERVRGIVNDDLGFADVPIPDEAFGHDLKWADAVPMFHNLRRAAAARGLAFGLKLSNTLEVENWRDRLRPRTRRCTCRAGRSTRSRRTWRRRSPRSSAGDLPLSFAGGADCFNVADLLARGHAHRHGLLGPAQVGRLPADAPVPGERRRRLRRGRRASTPPTSSAGRRSRARLRRATASDARRLRAVQPAPLRRRGPRRLALPEGLVPDGPLQDAARARARSTASRRPASTSARSTSRCPATWPRCAPGTSARPSASPASTTRCRRSWAASATTCARTPASAPTSTSRWRSGRSSASSWSRRRDGLADAAAGRSGDRTARVAIIGAGPAGLAAAEWLARAGHRASRSSRSTRTPAAWSAGRSPPTGCRRRRSTRTSPSSSASASRSATAQRAGVDVTLDDAARGRVRGDLRRRRAPSGRRRSACRARMPAA